MERFITKKEHGEKDSHEMDRYESLSSNATH